MPIMSHKAEKPAEAKEVIVAKTESDVAAATESATMPVQKANQELLESKSNTVAFVAALGDPSREDVTPENLEKGIKRHVDPTIVGFAFKALEDMDVPDCGTPKDLRNNNMAYVDATGKKHVKAGEVFYLTRFETGLMLSPEEFNGKATGGEMPVGCTYTAKRKTTKTGVPIAASSASAVPTVSLRPLSQGMSIKDIKMIDVLTFTQETKENGQSRKQRTINPGFEKWQSLCEAATRTVSAGAGAAANQKQRSTGAVKFLEIVNARK